MKYSFTIPVTVLLLLSSCIKPDLRMAKIRFQDTELAFGKISAGDTVIQSFNFENTGNDTLYILKVQPSCECMVADYTSAAILPGEYGHIKINYASNKKEDIGKQIKTIIVQTNSDTLLTVLKIIGIVENDSLKKVISQLKRI